MMKRNLTGMLVLVLALMVSSVGAETMRLEVGAFAQDCIDAPMIAEIVLPVALKGVALDKVSVILESADGKVRVPGQLLASKGNKAQLCWVIPSAKAGAKSVWEVSLSAAREVAGGFAFADEKGKHQDLLLDGKKVMRYMYAFDPSTPETSHETYKVYHHVFDETGERTLTKGSGGLYTHHRGLFIGWNKFKCGEDRYDMWHMTNGATQRHVGFASLSAGPVMARSDIRIDWVDKNNVPQLSEVRSIIAWRQSGSALLLIDFESKLTAVRDDVELDGDPEHAGMQYRPHNDVSKNPKELRAKYIFPTEKSDPTKDRDLAWAGLTYGLNDKQYVVQHMNHPSNPKGTRYSAYRDYGRFGAFPATSIKKGETLTVKYRIYVAGGSVLDRADMAQRSAAFASMPAVKVLP